MTSSAGYDKPNNKSNEVCVPKGRNAKWNTRTLVEPEKTPLCSMFRKSIYKENFKTHLQRLGYSKGSLNMLPACIAEFLSCLEEKGIYELRRVQPRHIREHYEYLGQRPNKRRPGGLSSGMIAIHLYAVRLFMEYLEQTGSITENPFSGLVFPGPESEPRDILSREEIILLYDRCENLRERAVLSLFYGCGLRRSEGEALNVEDVGFRAGLLYVREGKGKKRRAVPMSRQVCEDLKNYIENERYPNPGERAVIINGIGKRTRGFSFNDSVKRIVKRCGIKKAITLHCLRHSIATHLLAAGMNIEQVRNFMGHSDIDTTQVYTRVSRYQTKRL